jgi:hypothetical protein
MNDLLKDYDLEFEIADDDYEPSDDDMRYHWSGNGHIEFFVIQNTPEDFEIEIEDYSGCAGGMQETAGIEYYIAEVWGLNNDPETPLIENVTYTLHNLTVTWTRGDGWTMDDNVEYEFSHMTSNLEI